MWAVAELRPWPPPRQTDLVPQDSLGMLSDERARVPPAL
jgi:hypothetical protein